MPRPYKRDSMPKVLRLTSRDGRELGYTHWCPACDEYHAIYVDQPNPHTGAKWTFNGNMEAPTFKPNIRVHAICHYSITDGVLEYLMDSLHPMAGMKMQMPEGDIH